MSIYDLVFKPQEDEELSPVKEIASLAKRLDRALRFYCEECDRGFEKIQAKNMHARWHKGNPFDKKP